MHPLGFVSILTACCLSSTATSQITASATVTTTLESSGYEAFNMTSYSVTTPVGPLPVPTTMPSYSWQFSPTSLLMASSGSANTGTFWTPPGDFQREGVVEIVLSSPYETTCRVQLSGVANTSGAQTLTTVQGAVQASLSGFQSSLSLVEFVRVGPSGTSISIAHSMSGVAFFGPVTASANLAISWAPANVPETEAYGTGCLAPGPVLAGTALPQLGASMTAQVSAAPGPTPLGLVAIGFSDMASSAGTLPAPLAGIGMTDCFLLQSGELALPAVASSASTLDFSIVLPGDASLVGVNLFTQAFCFAPGANPLQVVASNGVRWQLGT